MTSSQSENVRTIVDLATQLSVSAVYLLSEVLPAVELIGIEIDRLCAAIGSNFTGITNLDNILQQTVNALQSLVDSGITVLDDNAVTNLISNITSALNGLNRLIG